MKKLRYILLIVPVTFSMIMVYLIGYIIINPVVERKERSEKVQMIDEEETLKEIEKKLSSLEIEKKIPPKVHRHIKDPEKEAEEFVNLIVKEAIEEIQEEDRTREKSILEKIKELF